MEDKTVKYIIWAVVGYAVIKYVLPSLTAPRTITVPAPSIGYGASTTPYQPGAQAPSPWAPGAPAQAGTSTDPTASIIGAVTGGITALGGLALNAYNSGVFGGGSSSGSYDTGGYDGGGYGGYDYGGYDDSPGGYVDNSSF